MPDLVTKAPPPEPIGPDRTDPSDAVRVQILATEHWSLLATRSMTWSGIFSWAGMYLTLLSGTLVALGFVGQATDFNDDFRAFAGLVLPVLLVLGLGTFFRLNDAVAEDARLVVGMNRLRRAYATIAPDLEPYFVTGSHDDEAGLLRTYGADPWIHPSRLLASVPVLVGIIDAVIAGVLAAVVIQALGGSIGLAVGLGASIGLVSMAFLSSIPLRRGHRFRRTHRPQFPSPEDRGA